jgi:protein-tyrosine phosphatase
VLRETQRAIFRQLPLSFVCRLVCCAPLLGVEGPLVERLFDSDESIEAFYETVLDNAIDPIKDCFEVLSDRNNYPIVVHCTAGKDRTGLLVALLLRLCDVPLTQVAEDYARSESHLAALLDRPGSLAAAVDDEPLLRGRTIAAPPQVIRSCLERIERERGSVRKYLEDWCGVPAEQLDTVRAILIRQDNVR